MDPSWIGVRTRAAIALVVACVAGARRTVDCLAIGATSCVAAGVDSYCQR